MPKGQYEASQALGMSTVQMTLFITLPQALRAVIPALVGQVIALFKDTSLVAIIGLADLLLVARAIVPGQPAFIGSQLENLAFVARMTGVDTARVGDVLDQVGVAVLRLCSLLRT